MSDKKPVTIKQKHKRKQQDTSRKGIIHSSKTKVKDVRLLTETSFSKVQEAVRVRQAANTVSDGQNDICKKIFMMCLILEYTNITANATNLSLI